MFNFRDVGGYRTAAGRTVRWRRLYRSDSLHALTEPDREAFEALGIRTVLDLRRPAEIERDGRVPDWNGLRWHNLYLQHRDWTYAPYRRGTDLARYLADRYRDMAEESASGLAAAVDLIADPAAAPLVVHCAAGKDRTGVLCALTLCLLGVPDDDVTADYALSSANLRRYLTTVLAENPEYYEPDELPLDTPVEAMRLFLAELRAEHGTVEGYLTAAGLPPARLQHLRNHLLE